MNRKSAVLATMIVLVTISSFAQKEFHTPVLIIGGGTGGTAAGIQCARMGVRVMIVEEGPWLGGMLSAAGVSAIDGNHKLPSGFWNEFRNAIYDHYGGPGNVSTGWVSNTMFEPHVADSIFKSMVRNEENLTILLNYRFLEMIKNEKKIIGSKFINTRTGDFINIYATLFIDATELGDVLANADVPYSVGMESGLETNEDVGVKESSQIIQDLTYVAILKDFGKTTDKTIRRPENYDPKEFDGACTDYYFDHNRRVPTVSSEKMLDYGRLPDNKFMINWPIYGNDIYLEVIGKNYTERHELLKKAKQQTLRFIYFIQHELGYHNLGLANDEFPTSDKLAIIPYYRESRRVKGLCRLTITHISKPFEYNYYRTGIAVGDYPIDHHHKKNPEAPQHLDFYPVPSFNVPLGALIPEDNDRLIVCDKNISVSNVANGTTRLQPVALQTGQAAGMLASLSVLQKKKPREISVRLIQKELLARKVMLMPYVDAGIFHPFFGSIQRIGATGILRGNGIPFRWANQTWFYPDSIVEVKSLMIDVRPYIKLENLPAGDLTIENALHVVWQFGVSYRPKIKTEFQFQSINNLTEKVSDLWQTWGLRDFRLNRYISRAEFAVLLDKVINPFELVDVDHDGNLIK